MKCERKFRTGELIKANAGSIVGGALLEQTSRELWRTNEPKRTRREIRLQRISGNAFREDNMDSRSIHSALPLDGRAVNFIEFNSSAYSTRNARSRQCGGGKSVSGVHSLSPDRELQVVSLVVPGLQLSFQLTMENNEFSTVSASAGCEGERFRGTLIH